MLLKSVTWMRDYDGLFNYQCKSLKHHNSFVLRKSSKICFFDNNIYIEDIESELNYEYKHILTVELINNTLALTPGPMCDKALLPLKKLKNMYRLSENDTLYLGKLKLKVHELSFPFRISDGLRVTSSNLMITGMAKKPKNPSILDSVGGLCRFCYQEEQRNNPIVSLCNCTTGIHIVCLRTWLSTTRTYIETKHTAIFSWGGLKCEVCLGKYPTSIEVDEIKYQLLPYVKPRTNYIVFSTQNTERFSIIVVAFRNKKKLVMGSNSDADVRLEDYTVSSKHAKLRYKDGSVFLSDNESRYGTLVKICKPVDINSDFKVQCGKNLLKFKKLGFKKSKKSCKMLSTRNRRRRYD